MHMRGRNIFCIYRLVQTSEWAEECGKIWVLFIPEYVINKWNLVYYYYLQYIVCTNILLSPGREWNFHQSKLSSQTSWNSNCLTQVWNVIWFVKKKSKKNRGATKHSNEPRTNPPSGVSKCREFYLACDGGVETKKTLDRTRYSTSVTNSKNPRGAEMQ